MKSRARSQVVKPGAKKFRSRRPLSRFGRFMNLHRIKSTDLAEISGVSRQHITRLRYDLMEPTRRVMLDLRTAMSAILCRRVYVSELFAIGEDDILGAIAFLSDAMLRIEGRPVRRGG